MKLVYWPAEETADAETHELETLGGLWEFIRAHETPTPGDTSGAFIREISANEGEDGTPYLVLSWVEVESD